MQELAKELCKEGEYDFDIVSRMTLYLSCCLLDHVCLDSNHTNAIVASRKQLVFCWL